MNKQLTKKTIGIAASAALMASVAFSSSALAGGKGKGKGPQGSIAVTNICTVNDDNIYDVTLTVMTTITDKSSEPGQAVIESFKIQAYQKFGGRDLFEVGDAQTGDPVLPAGGAVEVESTFHLCDDGINADGLDPTAKAANAQTTVMITDGHKVDGWISRCWDDPDTEIDEKATLSLAKGLCPQNAD